MAQLKDTTIDGDLIVNGNIEGYTIDELKNMINVQATKLNSTWINLEEKKLDKGTTIKTIDEKVGMHSDAEGGNMWIYSPQGNEWQWDAHDENFRLYNAETYNSMWYSKEGTLTVASDFQTTNGHSLNAKLDNDYRNDSNIGKGIIFGNNADGTYFTMRPILNQNLFQFTVNDATSALNIFSDGRMSTGQHFSSPNIDAMQSDINRMNEQKYYEIGGFILNGTTGYTVTGHGMATITILPNKIARIDYTVKISKKGAIVGCNWGLNSNLLTYQNSSIPHITPLNGGTATIYNADGTINDMLTGYGASHIAMSDFWNYGRAYQVNSENNHHIDYGQWEETVFTEGMRIVGTCYGTVA